LKKILVALGLIASLVFILLVIFKVVQNNNNAEDETLEYYQIVDEDFNKTVDVPFSTFCKSSDNSVSLMARRLSISLSCANSNNFKNEAM